MNFFFITAFKNLALGARFSYFRSEKIWVKISHNTVAEWRDSEIATGWTGQPICSFDELDDITKEVIVKN